MTKSWLQWLMISKTCWLKKNCPGILLKTRRRKLQRPDPRPKRSLVLFSLLKSEWCFSNDSCHDPPRSLSSSMEDRTYGILELLSLQGQQNLQADWQIWYRLACFNWNGDSRKFEDFCHYHCCRYYTLIWFFRRERERNRDLATCGCKLETAW